MASRLSSSLLPYLLVLLVGTCYVSARFTKLTRLQMAKADGMADDLPILEYETYNYTQTLDHFNYKPESYATFQQRYLIISKYWAGIHNNSPIFLYAGRGRDVTGDADYLGLVPELASRFCGLLVYIEHRYFGTSMPFGSKDEAYQNASTLGYLSSEQALADYAEIIINIKRNLSAENCPVIVVGASYGGMLASWFRLKYPHVIYGAFAASAPILYFEDITPHDGYDVKVSKYFRGISKNCYHNIRKSWFEIDKVAAQPNGLLTLSQTFNTCLGLKDVLEGMYDLSAVYDYPSDNWGNKICGGIDSAKGKDVLGKISAGVKTIFGKRCMNSITDYIRSGSTWQTCTEIVVPYGRGANDTMFQASPFNLTKYVQNCKNLFGVSPKPNWATTEFGGHNIMSVLKKFASNILFSNGLQDPFSIGGVLKNISDTVVAIYAEKGSHYLDLHTPNATIDPDWLVAMREREIKVIEGWLSVNDTS